MKVLWRIRERLEKTVGQEESATSGGKVRERKGFG